MRTPEDPEYIPRKERPAVERLRSLAEARNVGVAEPDATLDPTDYALPLLCAVGDPTRICSSCRNGDHDLCKGSCEDCGERYHADGDSVYIHDRADERFAQEHEWERRTA